MRPCSAPNTNSKGNQTVKTIVTAVVAVILMAGTAVAAETDFGNARGFGWQERARVCVALTPAQCDAVVLLQGAGSDGAGSGAAAAADSGASSSGGNGATGGSTGGSTSK